MLVMIGYLTYSRAFHISESNKCQICQNYISCNTIKRVLDALEKKHVSVLTPTCLSLLLSVNKKRGLSCCLFRGSGSRIAFQVEQTTRSPRRYVCAYILATSGYNPPIYETCMTSIYTPSGHPSLQCFDLKLNLRDSIRQNKA